MRKLLLILIKLNQEFLKPCHLMSKHYWLMKIKKYMYMYIVIYLITKFLFVSYNSFEDKIEK